jgi:DNA-binding SARP family transcriptional activator
MEFRILGPLVVLGDNGTEVQIVQPRQRALLSLLLLSANEPMSVDLLMDAIWGERPPQAASGALRTYVWALRRLLGPVPRLHTTHGGYLIDANADELDAMRFERLFSEARTLVSRGERALASRRLRCAVELWRNPPFADVPAVTSTAGRMELLRSLRYAAQELLVSVDISLGRYQHVVPGLRELLAEEPTRELCWAQLMVALYHSGRRAEALVAYGQASKALHDEFGIEPGIRLRKLHYQMLSEDPVLDEPGGGPLRFDRMPGVGWASR